MPLGVKESAELHAEDIRKTFLEERDMDMVIAPLTTAQKAAEICGCGIPELCPGPMAAIDEGDKIRTIYDGSWGGANAHEPLPPQSWTVSMASIGCRRHNKSRDIRSSLMPTGIGRNRMTWMLLKADVTKAHRRVKIQSPEWRYQVAKLGDEWWINKLGTYGMASAQLYWGRLASALLRLLYHVYPMVDWGFVFVDDFCWLLRKSLAGPLTSAILLLLVAFGCPLSWKKTAIGLSNTWLGFIMTPHLQLVRMAPTKHELVMAVAGQDPWVGCSGPLTVAHSQSPSSKRSGNGNQQSSPQGDQTSYRADRPTSCLFGEDCRRPTPYAPQSSWWGASDASASDSGEAYVGGWISNQPHPEKNQVWSGGFITRSKKTNILGPSRTASPSVELLLLRCWVHSFHDVPL